jgi:hypothetical protein
LIAGTWRPSLACLAHAFPCGPLFFGVSINAVPHDFSDEPRKPKTEPAARHSVVPPANDSGVDPLEFEEPNEPPPGLMRKRPHVALWILLALISGGIIALLLVALASD